jgi:copper transport protein
VLHRRWRALRRHIVPACPPSGSAYGRHLVRLGLLAAAAFLLRPLTAGPVGRTDGIILGVLGVAGLFTWPLAGHPAASPAPAVSVLVDAVHLGSMAVWLGGLVMLAVFLLHRADERELGAILPVWSRWAALAVAALLLAGAVQALIEVGNLDALLNTSYGRLLLAKVGLFVLVIAVAAYSRQLIRRRTAAQRPAPVRRAIWVELAVTAVVLGLSATLVQTTPARTAAADVAGNPTGFFTTTLSSSIYSLQVELDPAERGNNSLHLYAYTKDNRPQPVVEWRATAALPSAGIEPIEIPLLPLTDNHATGEINLPAAGEWQLRSRSVASEIDQATVTLPCPSDRKVPAHDPSPAYRNRRRRALASPSPPPSSASPRRLGARSRRPDRGHPGRLRPVRVPPNESDSASTTKVEVVLPENAPVGSVSTMPVPG